MKIRTGFVSNSSSSSFCLIVKKSDYDSVFEGMSSLEKEIIDYVKPKQLKAFGLDLVKINTFHSEDYFTLSDFYSEKATKEEKEIMEDCGAGEFLDIIINKLQEFDHIEDDHNF